MVHLIVDGLFNGDSAAEYRCQKAYVIIRITRTIRAQFYFFFLGQRTNSLPPLLPSSPVLPFPSPAPLHIIIIMTRRQLRSVATTLHDDRDPVPSSTPV